MGKKFRIKSMCGKAEKNSLREELAWMCITNKNRYEIADMIIDIVNNQKDCPASECDVQELPDGKFNIKYSQQDIINKDKWHKAGWDDAKKHYQEHPEELVVSKRINEWAVEVNGVKFISKEEVLRLFDTCVGLQHEYGDRMDFIKFIRTHLEGLNNGK